MPRALLAAAALVLLALVVWRLAFTGDDGGTTDTAVAPSVSTPSAATSPAGTPGTEAATGWAAAVPKPAISPVIEDDAKTIDAREVAPARFRHQLALVRRALRGSEEILTLRVQSDGTLVSLVGNTTGARYVATKKDLHPQVPPQGSGDALRELLPLAPSDIDARVPMKLLRAVHRAGGVTPGTLYLSHTPVTPGAQSALFGDAPAWTIKWTGLVGTVVASADGHRLKAATN
ncbi:MAG: hypothetical protein AAGC46_08610 [Solirubrobacteraceae bacterium]